MAECVILKGGSTYGSDDCSANKAQVLKGYTAITRDSDDEPAEGTINSKAAETYYATTLDQTINAGQYLSGAQTIKKLTQTGLSGANIKPGVTVKINNGNTDVFSVASSMAAKAAATYYATTSDQTIAKDQYLTGVQTIKKLTQSGLSAGNILHGTTVTINNGNANVWSVTGSLTTPVRNDYVVAVKGYGAETNVLTSESEYKMPRSGQCYYGLAMTGYGGTPRATIEVLVNNVVKHTFELQSSSTSHSFCYSYSNWQREDLNANDTMKMRCTITSGTNVFCEIGAHFSC